MEKIERKMLAVILLSCSVCFLVVIGWHIWETTNTVREENIPVGQTMVVMSRGTLHLSEQECAYTIVADTDTARRYLIIEDADNKILITSLELPYHEHNGE